jgi:hypothetical protein
MASGGTRIKNGSVTGTGAALNVRTVGFRPRKVELINKSSSDKLTWTESMADAAGHKQVAAGTSSFITSLGITPLSDGFTIGADTDLNVSGEDVYWTAHE